MKHLLRLFRFSPLVLMLSLSGVVPCLATDAVAKRRATLRGDPSAQHKPLLTLQAGDDVELIDPSPTHNYYHVRTAEGAEGWIFASNLEIVTTTPSVPSVPTTPSIPPATPSSPSNITGVTGTFSLTWDKPVPAPTTFDGPDGHCGPTGDGGDAFTNLRKNRTDVPQPEARSVGQFTKPRPHQRLDLARSRASRSFGNLSLHTLGNSPHHENRGLREWGMDGRRQPLATS